MFSYFVGTDEYSANVHWFNPKVYIIEMKDNLHLLNSDVSPFVSIIESIYSKLRLVPDKLLQYENTLVDVENQVVFVCTNHPFIDPVGFVNHNDEKQEIQ